MLSPFVLHSNLGGKERFQIMKDDLGKLADEDWKELKRQNVHVCIIDDSEYFNIVSSHPSIEEIDVQIKEDSKRMESSGEVPKDVLPFL